MMKKIYIRDAFQLYSLDDGGVSDVTTAWLPHLPTLKPCTLISVTNWSPERKRPIYIQLKKLE